MKASTSSFVWDGEFIKTDYLGYYVVAATAAWIRKSEQEHKTGKGTTVAVGMFMADGPTQ